MDVVDLFNFLVEKLGHCKNLAFSLEKILGGWGAAALGILTWKHIIQKKGIFCRQIYKSPSSVLREENVFLFF